MNVLQGLLDVLQLGERDASNIGKQTFLPNSFIGGPRDMRQRYMDAIALVQHFGKPNLFITMTCNPSWMEIEEHLSSSDEEQNRPDLISRVFQAKIEELKIDILKRNIFGKVAAFMYTVEFQKRGLPHAHFLIILSNEHKLLTIEAYDDIIKAELPDKVCSDIKVVKYLYKYICKRHDEIEFSVQNNDANIEIDEVKEYRTARWVSPPEALWHLFGFSISEMSPSVYRLQLHLEVQQFVSFKSNVDINTIVNNLMIKKMMLTEFFYMNQTDEDAIELNLLYKEFPEYFVWSSSDKFWALRKQRSAIGRIVTCHPTEGERYYLRLLLMHVRGPKSYNDLLTVNGESFSTFRESMEKREFLHVYCNPTNPRQLWEQFEESMTEDYKVLQTNERKQIRYQALNHINDILHSMGHDVNEYELIPETIRPSTTTKEAKEVHFEKSITVSEEDMLLHTRLNKKQLTTYNVITDRIFSNKAGAFFVDGPGGTGKTFLYRALLETVRSMGYIALATATSGVVASILPDGRIAHSHFKISINIDEHSSCNISKQSALAGLILDEKLIVWDEVSMANKRMLEVFDFLLKDLMNTNVLFGGKVVVLGGDFRQILPVVRNGKKEDFINESLLYSRIWYELEKLQLSENMRAKIDPPFCDYLMRIGNGYEQASSTNKIKFFDSLVIPFTTERESLDKLFTITYPDLNLFYSNTFCTNSHYRKWCWICSCMWLLGANSATTGFRILDMKDSSLRKSNTKSRPTHSWFEKDSLFILDEEEQGEKQQCAVAASKSSHNFSFMPDNEVIMRHHNIA
uniref:ATP-dependent DNA helicase n=1 Tax=Nicotiana tabacum TaxID=4097 RepID=A0A1S4C0L3_TOBAC|nr:PREDICTED: uncharacterized protein LOC107813895 [Nicotiana tabacum]